MEVFEVTPDNYHVISTKGRLRRSFPASALSIKQDAFQDADFCAVFASTLAKMSQQRVPGTQLNVKRATKYQDEDRDTTHPRMVTEFLMAFLSAVGVPAHTSTVSKNTREEVNFRSSLFPWRRSSLWLLIRVVLQLSFSRSRDTLKSQADHDLYKEFMIHHMSNILSRSLQYDYHSDIFLAMSAKLHRRLAKLESIEDSVRRDAHRTLRHTNSLLEKRWALIQNEGSPNPPLDSLNNLNFKQDTLTDVPLLDQFIDDLNKRSTDNSHFTFKPEFTLTKYKTDDLPGMNPSSGDYMVFDLIAFEAWVATSLDKWLDQHGFEVLTCGRLRYLVETYHRRASSQYSGNPESTSLMILTIMELWIACDKVAILACPLLQEYDPDIPVNLLQNLMLPIKSQMKRLQSIETYLSGRSFQSKFPQRAVLGAFGTESSFSVRWFRQSAEHQQLQLKIEQWATELREAKRAEFASKRELYELRMTLHDQRKCEFAKEWNPYERTYKEQHSNSCEKCQSLRDANSMSIDIHEWPLPPDTLDSESTVFELQVPEAFGHWRDVTCFLLADVLGCVYTCKVVPQRTYTLDSYQGLSRFFVPIGQSQRIIALSETKPHKVTRRRDKPVASTTEDDICLINALNYSYHDNTMGCFVDAFSSQDKVERECTYTLPSKSSALQKFLSRPPQSPDGPSPNTVLATQSDCPDHLSLDEYKALCTIPLGTRIQWQNIFIQLHAPSIDFKRIETTFIILQCILQAGPCEENNLLRQGHQLVNDPIFASRLLDGLQEALHRIEGNWQASYALLALISLACRSFSLTSARDIREKCLDFLSRARGIAMTWLGTLKEKTHSSTDDGERAELRTRSVAIALLCSATFDIDQEGLEQVLTSTTQACIFLQCSIITQEGKQCIPESDSLTTLLHRRWQRLCYRAYEALARNIVEGKDDCLDDTITKSWPAYQARAGWERVSLEHKHWLVNNATNPGTEDFLNIHFNLLDGELLVNGLPLGRLPAEYERHPVYRQLFGRATIEVMPTAIPGMRFSGKNKFAAYTLHFGMSSESHLLIRAEKDGRAYELVSSKVMWDNFPMAFVQERVHWYDMTNDRVEFRCHDTPWNFSLTDWTLNRRDRSGLWDLTSCGRTLVALNRDTAKVVTQVLCSLEGSLRTHCILDEATGVLDVELPRIQLGFYIRPGCDRISSRQYRGMFVDKHQQLGSLIGLGSKLVLRGKGERPSRMIIIPHGDVSFAQTEKHVSISIDKDSATKAYAYHVDDRLGRLLDNGSLVCKLWLCYMHALTSFCIPDPLTRRTGTEQALSILDSAAVKSFDTLSADTIDILEKISQLTPKRSYYPANERMMQDTDWVPGLGFIAQHGRFYTSVRQLFLKHAQSRIFCPETYVEPPPLEDIEMDLLDRDNIRSSALRVSDFGAESFTVEHDVLYPARDRWQNSPSAASVAAVADIVYHKREQASHEIPQKLADHIWQYLLHGNGIITSAGGPLSADEFAYDSRWLSNQTKFISQNWTRIHHTISRDRYKISKFSLMMWLSTLSFAEEPDMPIIYTLASFYTTLEMVRIMPPQVQSFDLKQGAGVKASELCEQILPLGNSLYDSPEVAMTRVHGDSTGLFDDRQQSTFKINRSKALTKLVASLSTQWPCETPSRPLDSMTGDWREYFDIDRAIVMAEPKFKGWYDNYRFRHYLDRIEVQVSRRTVQVQMKSFSLPISEWNHRATHGFLSTSGIFACPAPPNRQIRPPDMTSALSLSRSDGEGMSRLAGLVSRLGVRTASVYEEDYLTSLKESLNSLQSHSKEVQLVTKSEQLKGLLLNFRKYYTECVAEIYAAMLEAVGVPDAEAGSGVQQWPRLSPVFFLQHLARNRWKRLPEDWKVCIVHYGLALSMLQQTERRLAISGNEAALIKELANTGHTSWDAHEHPESLLLEVESGITIREVQEQIAKHMRAPLNNSNQVMQLNMGEGKSSVIVPMVAAALADGSRLVRVIVAKPQAKQMFEMLVSKLGGLLGRPVFHLPFSRGVKFRGEEDAICVQRLFEECIAAGGVLLVQPEHILSFKLMAIERKMMDQEAVADPMLKSLEYLTNSTRDIVDESDENFSVKFELVYTIGVQRPIDHSPDRWTCIQEILEIFRRAIPSLKTELGGAVEVHLGRQGSFPRTRILRENAQDRVLEQIATMVCETGLTGLPIARQPESTRSAVRKYISKVQLRETEIDAVEESAFWSDTTSSFLLLLRGLIAEGVLAFAFTQKRWRVDYGLDHTRRPATRLAVPYRAKDNPSARSEFSHPDVVILLTSLSYYYSGLSNQDLFMALHHLYESDQADIEYQAWIKDADSLPLAFRQLGGINLEDHFQCTHQVFPHLRSGKAVIDYFLAHLVFPKEMREFPHKLSASGWDIGEQKTNPTTGFSGTNDSRVTLPLTVDQLDVPDQTHTNALVLNYLLRPENSIALMQPSDKKASGSIAESLLKMVVESTPPVRVILDVGAQILELDNLGVARAWLDMLPDDGRTRAAVFFDENDHICVLDQSGLVEQLHTSPFATQLDLCLIFLDEVHTRGTDLKLPQDYRAAVTLGVNLTKDRLVQGTYHIE